MVAKEAQSLQCVQEQNDRAVAVEVHVPLLREGALHDSFGVKHGVDVLGTELHLADAELADVLVHIWE